MFLRVFAMNPKAAVIETKTRFGLSGPFLVHTDIIGLEPGRELSVGWIAARMSADGQIEEDVVRFPKRV
jgi:hypothetical protein